jgi:lon-related putative ATP-dependent protease
MTPSELTAEQLRRRCNPQDLPIASSAEAPALNDIIGQERATRAIDFGIDIPSPGYNIFAMGPAGTGKTSTVLRFLERKAAARPVPEDWGYSHNFADPDRPLALRLPSGGGARLREQVNQLLRQVAEALAKTFAGDQYAEHRNAVAREVDRQRNERLRELDNLLHEQNFDLVRSENGLVIAPAKDGQPLTREQYDTLSEADQQAIAERQPAAEEALERTMRQVREIGEAGQASLNQLDQQIAAVTIKPFFEPLQTEYAGWPDVVRYLDGIQAHMTAHISELNPVQEQENEAARANENGAANGAPAQAATNGRKLYDRYHLNVIVDNHSLAGAPVVLETNPTYTNLLGRVEGRPEFGTLVTDYRYIKAGALHRANGGYLVLDARVMLRQPLAWEAIKQALRNRRIRMEDMGQQPGILVVATLAPEPIPLDLKIILIGDPATYYTLFAYDEQFETLFKVRADFAVEMDWTPTNELKIGQLVRVRCEEENLPTFDVSAVARIIEHSARLVEDQRKLTTQFAHVNDLVRESAFWATRTGHNPVTGEDVARAIDERIYRSNQFEEKLRDLTVDGTVLVNTGGAVVGQVNGLAVLELGDYAFGKPSRITARTYQGRSGVINIEREAKLSGRIHDKGVLILAGFLGGRYAQDKPLSLSASLAFEQSYEGVDGDSASSTELYALLSSLSGLPIRQSLAVTGSVNQLGEVQAIGGATLKIEGFFDVCRVMPGGLTGEQGVLLPAANVPNLMLREDVVDAVAAGKFHIYPVRAIDEGIEILTGRNAGERGPAGAYPADSVNGLVDARLRQLAEEPRNGNGLTASERNHRVAKEPDEETPAPPRLPGDLP